MEYANDEPGKTMRPSPDACGALESRPRCYCICESTATRQPCVLRVKRSRTRVQNTSPQRDSGCVLVRSLVFPPLHLKVPFVRHCSAFLRDRNLRLQRFENILLVRPRGDLESLEGYADVVAVCHKRVKDTVKIGFGCGQRIIVGQRHFRQRGPRTEVTGHDGRFRTLVQCTQEHFAV